MTERHRHRPAPTGGSAWIACSRPHLGLRASPLLVELCDAAKARPDTSEQCLMDGERRLGQPIVGELPFSGRFHESCPVEVPEVARDGGLGKPQELDEVADAEFARDEQIQDANPRGICEASE